MFQYFRECQAIYFLEKLPKFNRQQETQSYLLTKGKSEENMEEMKRR